MRPSDWVSLVVFELGVFAVAVIVVFGVGFLFGAGS